MSVPTVSSESELDINDLAGADWATLWWGMFWRSLVVLACSMLVATLLGAVTGGMLGVVISLAHWDVKDFLLPLRLIGGLLGFVVSIASFPFWLRWLLRSRFGRIRIALISMRSKAPELKPEREATIVTELGQ